MQFGFSHGLKKQRLVNKQVVYYINNTKSLFLKGIYLSEENMGQNTSSVSKSDFYNFSKTRTKVDDLEDIGEIQDCNYSY